MLNKLVKEANLSKSTQKNYIVLTPLTSKQGYCQTGHMRHRQKVEVLGPLADVYGETRLATPTLQKIFHNKHADKSRKIPDYHRDEKYNSKCSAEDCWKIGGLWLVLWGQMTIFLLERVQGHIKMHQEKTKLSDADCKLLREKIMILMK